MAQRADLNESERRFLAAVEAHPGQPSSTYASRAGMTPSIAVRARVQLERLGVLRVRKVQTGRRGRPALLVEVAGDA